MHLLTGPPGEITDLKISSDTVTACSFVVQWSRPFSHPVCSTVEYTVTVSLEGRIISSNKTMQTSYNVSGVNSRTMYTVNVIASNDAGNTSSAASVQAMTNGKFIFCMWIVLCICTYVCITHKIKYWRGVNFGDRGVARVRLISLDSISRDLLE